MRGHSRRPAGASQLTVILARRLFPSGLRLQLLPATAYAERMNEIECDIDAGQGPLHRIEVDSITLYYFSVWCHSISQMPWSTRQTSQ